MPRSNGLESIKQRMEGGGVLTESALDLITMGRAIVDVYGDQVGCRLEEVTSFSRYVGGCPANIAIGTARLGLRVGMITRVGDEQHGRFLREQLQREGVDITCVRTDPARLTGIVFLGIRDRETFPLLHYRSDCADMAIAPEDYSAEYVASAKALLFSGSHLTTAKAPENIAVALARARAGATRVIFDIDFRPLFWGLARKDAGESRFVESTEVTSATQRFLPRCDLVVGTTEEIHIAGGTTDTLAALRTIRSLTVAPIVLKRGPQGCVVFPDAIPASIEGGIVGPGFPVDVFNVVGAGDGFMAGFLYDWLRDAPWEDCSQYGNACGALVVSRHGCSPASPTNVELNWFLERSGAQSDLFRNRELAHVHRATTRRARPAALQIVARDNDLTPESFPSAPGRTPAAFNSRVAELVLGMADEYPGIGVILDSRTGEDALYRIGSRLPWLARRLEVTGKTPLEFQEGLPASIALRYWPQHQIVKCLVPDAVGRAIAIQEERLRELYLATQYHGNELLLELASEDSDAGIARVLVQLRAIDDIGVRPDWWMLPAFSRVEAWTEIAAIVGRPLRFCRGIVVVVDTGRSDDALDRAFSSAARHPLIRGFAVAGTHVSNPAQAWLAGKIDGPQLETMLRERFVALAARWADAAQ